MRISCRSDIVVKESDFKKLMSLLQSADTDIATTLEQELTHANIVEDKRYPKNAVCMGSLVTYVELISNQRKTIRLVYPDQANLDEMKVSVLSPVGCALIGMKRNCSIDWKMLNNQHVKFKVESVEQICLSECQ
ncbi:MAG: nucleoside diphosphate kinase regulator [Porticoccus sp.]|nr:nucleoside diphosphate kinase regulator [Porticoccus sp.]